MAKTVTILYDSRAEAELARERLATELKAQGIRVLGKDTVAAIDGLKFDKKEAFALRQALRRGDHVVTAEVPNGTTPDRIISLLGLSSGVERPSQQQTATSPMGHGIDRADKAFANTLDPGEKPAELIATEPPFGSRPTSGPQNSTSSESARHQVAPTTDLPNSATPQLRSGSYGSLSDAEVEAAGLFKERTIDFAEMREEAVVTKEAIVREEVIVTKTVKERTETIRDTVRHTEFEVQQLEPAASTRSPPLREQRRT